MADYRELAAALGGGYGQDTGGITPDTLATLRNGKKASASDLLGMLKAIGSGSLSNLESLVRGGVAQIPGTAGDLEGLARMGINKAFGAGGVNVNPTPVLPTTTDILGMMPRKTAARPESAGMEELGGYMSPAFGKIAKPAVTSYAKLAGQEINAGLTGQPTRSLLGDITPKPKNIVQPESNDFSYRGQHTAPGPDFGAPLHDLSQIYPDDIYSSKAAQYYGHSVPYDQKAALIMQQYKNKPDATVTIYRAIPKEISNAEKLAEIEKQMAAYMRRGTLPKDAENYSSGSKWYDNAYEMREKLRQMPNETPQGISDINAGDWVTLTREYAKDHGESALRGQYKIISKKVKAKDIWTNADSIHEFGYQPQ